VGVREQMKRLLILVSVLVAVTSLVAAMLIQTRSYSLAPCIVGVRESHCGGPLTDYRIALRLAVAGIGVGLSGAIGLVARRVG
jgi:hypothetical protein